MINAADFLKWLNIFNVPYSGNPGSEVVISWNGSTNPVNVTAGSGIDITGGVISTTAGPSPLVSGFSATLSNPLNNSTGDGTIVNVICDNVNFNIDNSYNNSTGIYIAPVDGIYSFGVSVFLSNLSASHNQYLFYLVANNVTYIMSQGNPANERSSTNQMTRRGILNVELKAGQQVKMQVEVDGTSKTVTIGSGIQPTAFFGYFVGTDTGIIGVSSLNGLTGDLNITSSANSLNITQSSNNINIDILSPVSIANGGTNATSQTTNGINYFDGTKITSLPALTNGQIYIGSTGFAPVPANITPGTGITIANSTGIIIISATGNGPYTELTSSVGIFSNHTYTANSSSLITMTLPSTSAIGDYIKINYKGTGGWKIAQNAGQQIQYGTMITTSGTGGSLASSAIGDCVTLVCITANTFWQVQSSQGNLTVV